MTTRTQDTASAITCLATVRDALPTEAQAQAMACRYRDCGQAVRVVSRIESVLDGSVSVAGLCVDCAGVWIAAARQVVSWQFTDQRTAR